MELYIILTVGLYIAGLAILVWIGARFGSRVAIIAGVACTLIATALVLETIWNWTRGFVCCMP